MKTLNRFASVMEAFPLMDPVDPRSDRFGPAGPFRLGWLRFTVCVSADLIELF